MKPRDLIDELIASGNKCNIDDIVYITKTTEGKLLWLEKGNSTAGLQHIIERHANDFSAKGFDNIPQLLSNVLKTKPIKIGSSSKGFYANYILNENVYRLAYGTNGFIVSFYPIA